MRYFLILLFFWGCSQPRFTQKVGVDTIKVVPPIIEENIKAIDKDTVVIGEKIFMKDTVLVVKYYPLEKKFYVKAKPDTIKIIRIDTVMVMENKENNNEGDYWILSIVLTALIILIIMAIKK